MSKKNEKDQQISDLEAKLAEKEKENLTLFSMLYETLEKQGCENIVSTIEQMTNLTLEKQSNWFKGNRNYDQLKQQLAEKEKEISEVLAKQSITCLNTIEKAYQDKISFALEQLEKTRKLIDELLDNCRDKQYKVIKGNLIGYTFSITEKQLHQYYEKLTPQHEDKGE